MLRLRVVSPAFVSKYIYKTGCSVVVVIVVIEPGRAELLCRNPSGGAIATATSVPAPAAAAAAAASGAAVIGSGCCDATAQQQLLLRCCLSDGVVLGLPLSVSL